MTDDLAIRLRRITRHWRETAAVWEHDRLTASQGTLPRTDPMPPEKGRRALENWEHWLNSCAQQIDDAIEHKATMNEYPTVLTFKLPPDDEMRPRILAAAKDNGLTVTFLTDTVFTVAVETPDDAYELGRDAAKLKGTIRR